jgi:hypothetical protein
MKNKGVTEAQARDYCRGCLKLKGNSCQALKELWLRFGDKGECWAREENPVRWLNTLKALDSYRSESIGRVAKADVQTEIRHLEAQVAEMSTADIAEVYEEDLRRGKGGGGGEKADRTNKTFGPQQMKDNRFMHRKRNPRKYYEY